MIATTKRLCGHETTIDYHQGPESMKRWIAALASSICHDCQRARCIELGIPYQQLTTKRAPEPC